MKRTTCFVCHKPLTGIKTKYCGDVCYQHYKNKNDKEIRARRNALTRPPRNCHYCNKQFHPIRADHIACSKPCSYEHSKHLQKLRRLTRKPQPRVRPLDAGIPKVKPAPSEPLKIELKTTAEFNTTSQFREAVLEYLKNGGKISRLPDEPQGKTPSVNIPFGYTPSELYGHGLEYELSVEASVEANASFA